MENNDTITINIGDTANVSYDDVLILSNWEDANMSFPASNDYITINSSDTLGEFSWLTDWKNQEEWNNIRHAAVNNEALQKAIERVKILYYLSKEDGNT